MIDITTLGVTKASDKAIEILVRDSLGEDYYPEIDTGLDWQEFMDTSYSGEFEGLTAKVEAEYGGEGCGEQYWMVVSLSDGKTIRYFRKDGYYASYDGGTLDGEVYEVKPVTREVIFYETEKEAAKKKTGLKEGNA